MKNNISRLEKKAEIKAKAREKKRKTKIAVSGKSVFKLRDIIVKKKRLS